MTLKIHNIMYDHTQEFRTYPAGVLTIDTTTRAIHVHDGLTPNGWALPTVANLDDYALKDLTNVTQESMNNALNTFGAMNLNKNDPLGTTQKDNFWSQVGGTVLKSDAEVPKKNYLYVDGKTKTIQAGDLNTMLGWGLDPVKAKSRLAGSTYTADANCWVLFRWVASVEAATAGLRVYLNGTQIIDDTWYHTARNGGFSHAITHIIPVSAGQKYRGEGQNSKLYITEYQLALPKAAT